MTHSLSPRDLLRLLLDVTRQAHSAPSEAEVAQAATLLLLESFQAGRATLRLVGSAADIVATGAADGSITLLPLSSTSGQSAVAIAELLEPPAAAGQQTIGSEPALPLLSALLQDEEETLGSVELSEPRLAGHFTPEQRLMLPLVAHYIALLLRDRRQREQAADLAVADERSRLARELHDTVAQSLVALALRLERIEEPRKELEEARLLARRALEDARRAIWGLRPALLEALPFHEALAREVEHVADEGGLSSRVTVVGQPRPLLPQQEMALFRIAQEALSNAIRHAAARRVRAGLTYLDDGARLVIEDDGRGFDPAALEASALAGDEPGWPPYFADAGSSAAGEARHFGLQTMRERARLVGGWLTIESTPGQGTHITIDLPYAPRADLLLPAADQETANESVPETEIDHPQSALSPVRQAPVPLPAKAVPSARPAISAGRLRLLVVDDHAVIRAGMRRLLESYPDFEVVGEAADGLEALAEAQDLGPQVILMDMRMPGMNGLEALRQLRISHPDVRILMLSAYEQDEDVLESLKAGASGYVLKGMEPDELAQAIRAVAQGETLLAPGLTGKLVEYLGRPTPEDSSSLLTARESEVLRALASGLRNKEIARQLHISERTVTFHLAHVYQKLGVTSRTEALSRALELGLLKA